MSPFHYSTTRGRARPLRNSAYRVRGRATARAPVLHNRGRAFALDVREVRIPLLRLPFPKGRQHFARAYPEISCGGYVAAQSPHLQPLRIFRVENREGARNNGRQDGEETLLPYEQKDLQQTVFHRLFFRLFRRYGKTGARGT